MKIRLLICLLLSGKLFASIVADDTLYVNWKYSGTETGSISQPYDSLISAVNAITFPLTENWVIMVKGTKGTEDDGVALQMDDYDDWYFEHFYPDSSKRGTATYSVKIEGYSPDSLEWPVFTSARELSGTWIEILDPADVWKLDVSANNWYMKNAEIQGAMCSEDLAVSGFYEYERDSSKINVVGEFAIDVDGSKIAQTVYIRDKGDADPNSSGHTYYVSPVTSSASYTDVAWDLEDYQGKNAVDYWIISKIHFKMAGTRAMWTQGHNLTMDSLNVWGSGIEGLRLSGWVKGTDGKHTITNSTFWENAGHGIQVNTWDCTFQNLHSYNNGEGGCRDQYGASGLIVLGGRNIIEYSQFNGNDQAGMYDEGKYTGVSDSYLACCDSNIWRYNLVYDNRSAGFISMGGHHTTVIGNVFYQNNIAVYGSIFEQSTYSFQGMSAPYTSADSLQAKQYGNKYFNNTIYHTYKRIPTLSAIHLCSWAITLDPPDPTIIKNNIIYVDESATTQFLRYRNPDNTKIQSENNIMYGTGGGTWTCIWGVTSYTTLADWQSNTSLDANSQVIDPKLTDVSNTDFTLLLASPCIDNGEDLGSTFRYVLCQTSSWPSSVTREDQYGDGKWDIGAFRYPKWGGIIF